jgi:hypothetical protein
MSHILNDTAAHATIITDPAEATDPLHLTALAVAASHEARGWNKRPALYALTGPDIASPIPDALPLPERLLQLAGGVTLAGGLLYALRCTGAEAADNWKTPWYGYAAVDEAFGLLGDVAEREAKARAAGRRRVPIADRPDRVEMRFVVLCTIQGRLVNVIQRRNDGGTLLTEPHRDYVAAARERSELTDLLCMCVDETLTILTDAGIDPYTPRR